MLTSCFLFSGVSLSMSQTACFAALFLLLEQRTALYPSTQVLSSRYRVICSILAGVGTELYLPRYLTVLTPPDLSLLSHHSGISQRRALFPPSYVLRSYKIRDTETVQLQAVPRVSASQNAVVVARDKPSFRNIIIIAAVGYPLLPRCPARDSTILPVPSFVH